MSRKRKPERTVPGADYNDSAALSEAVMDILRRANRPLGMDELLRIGGFSRRSKKNMEASLVFLQDTGRVARSSGGWTIASLLKRIEGELSIQRSGAAFVSPADGGPDIYVHPAALNDAWPGDTVEVLVLPARRGPRREGRVLRVLRRAKAELVVEAVRRQRDGLWLSAPQNKRIPALFITETGAIRDEVAEGDLLLVRPGEKAGPNLWHGSAMVNLQHEETPLAQERIVKSIHSIPGPFPAGALAEAAMLPQNPAESDFEGRVDLRNLDFVTIDGRTARDFDDAVSVRALLHGGFRLLVAIADVGHYVPQGGALDAEARLRGNSCYFPLSVEPMLPEALSNGLCSLKPGVPRLAMVMDMEFSALGERTKADFYEAVIQSRARLTYGQIERGLLLGEDEEVKTLAPVLPMLREAESLARLLLGRRNSRGALDFDTPEARFVFDAQNILVAIQPEKRHFGHRIIEECMIAANEAVATFLEKENESTLYRVHQPPDAEKMSALLDFLAESGLYSRGGAGDGGRAGRKRVGPPSLGDLQRIIASAAGTPREFAVTRMILRSMMQARYQADNEGHYGLASSAYCHATSPIRRYADLVVHRALKRAIGASRAKAPSPAALERTAEHINSCERTAVDAEREINKRLGVLYLKDRVGSDFDGLVSGVTDFGIFVELPEVMAEGMVRLTALVDDYYVYLPERQELRGRGTRRSFRLGQAVRVRITDVNTGRMEINLAPVDEPACGARRRPKALAGAGRARTAKSLGKTKSSGRTKRPGRARRGLTAK